MASHIGLMHYVNIKPLMCTIARDIFIGLHISAGAVKTDPECSAMSIQDFAIGFDLQVIQLASLPNSTHCYNTY
jgi:hypothetical protein